MKKPRGPRRFGVRSGFFPGSPFGDYWRPGMSWLYLIGLRDGRIKVGITSNPRDRVMRHKVAFQDALLWVHLGACGDMDLIAEVEQRAIEALAEIGAQVGRTEMFRGITPPDALSTLRRAHADVVARWEAEEAALIAQRAIAVARRRGARRKADLSRCVPG